MEAAEGPVKVIPHREHLVVEGVMLHKLPSVTRNVTLRDMTIRNVTRHVT